MASKVQTTLVSEVVPKSDAASTSVQSKVVRNQSNSIPLEAVHFDDLPDCAYVRQPTVLTLFSCSKATLWRWVKSERLPPPLKLGLRLSAWNVGQLRSCLKSMEASGLANSSKGGAL